MRNLNQLIRAQPSTSQSIANITNLSPGPILPSCIQPNRITYPSPSFFLSPPPIPDSAQSILSGEIFLNKPCSVCAFTKLPGTTGSQTKGPTFPTLRLSRSSTLIMLSAPRSHIYRQPCVGELCDFRIRFRRSA